LRWVREDEAMWDWRHCPDWHTACASLCVRESLTRRYWPMPTHIGARTHWRKISQRRSAMSGY